MSEMEAKILEKASEFLEKQAELLGNASGLPSQSILEEIEALIHGGAAPEAAVVEWKSANSFALGKGRGEYTVRVVHKGDIRDVGPDPKTGEARSVQTVHYATEDLQTGDITFTVGGLWNERITEVGEQLTEGNAFKFKASAKRDGSLIRIGDITALPEPASIPTLTSLESYPLDNLHNRAGEHELVKGIVGRLIVSRTTSETIGVDLGNLDSLLPVTVWFGDRYNPTSPEQKQIQANVEKGDSIAVYGYVNVSGTNVNIRAIKVIPC